MRKPSPSEIRAIMALADLFLDTEVRPTIPYVAAAALEAGWDGKQMCDCLVYDVAPIVGPNVWSVAGEWAGWDEAWLLEQVQKRRKAGWRLPRPVAYPLFYATTFMWREARAVQRMMHWLSEVPAERREGVVAEIAFLASAYFDMDRLVLERSMKLSEKERERLWKMFTERCLPIFEPLLCHLQGESSMHALERVSKALGYRE